MNYQQKLDVAQNQNTPTNVLEALATDKDHDVRYKVATNPNTSANALETLATDEDHDVRYNAAMNPSTTEIVKRLYLMTEAQLYS